MKRKVLIIAGYYLPSVKGGGPVQSIKNIVDNLSENIDFYILASDRDFGDDKPFTNIKTEEWINIGNAKVYYTDIAKLTWRKTKKIINSINYDVLYLNSFFSYKFSIIPLLLNKMRIISAKRIVLAPRGQFAEGAFNYKRRKKNIYIKIAKALCLYKGVIWHATTETEKIDIQKVFGIKNDIRVAGNLTANYMNLTYNKKIEKKKGELKLIFVSRIHHNKNLKKAIELLKNVNGNIEFNIYGPIEDRNYWLECEEEIKRLPSNVKVLYKGVVNHDNVIEAFKSCHVFLFPTLGENFGHVISEALIGGCPIIISDQTPWRNLEERGVGWDISLYDESKFIEALQRCINMEKEEYDAMSKRAFHYGKLASNTQMDINNTYELFK